MPCALPHQNSPRSAPWTGQPDFAHLVIDYVPDAWLVESKSLKLYLGAFRNHGAFHEDCTVSIGKRLVDFLSPQWLRIGGYWYPRGGIPIDVFYQTGPTPQDCWIPDQGATHLSWPRLIAQFFKAAFLCILGHAHRPLHTRALHIFFAAQAPSHLSWRAWDQFILNTNWRRYKYENASLLLCDFCVSFPQRSWKCTTAKLTGYELSL